MNYTFWYKMRLHFSFNSLGKKESGVTGLETFTHVWTKDKHGLMADIFFPKPQVNGRRDSDSKITWGICRKMLATSNSSLSTKRLRFFLFIVVPRLLQLKFKSTRNYSQLKKGTREWMTEKERQRASASGERNLESNLLSVAKLQSL